MNSTNQTIKGCSSYEQPSSVPRNLQLFLCGMTEHCSGYCTLRQPVLLPNKGFRNLLY